MGFLALKLLLFQFELMVFRFRVLSTWDNWESKSHCKLHVVLVKFCGTIRGRPTYGSHYWKACDLVP